MGAAAPLELVPPRERALLERAGAAADGLRLRLAWVGGGVRDLLLGRGRLDLDLVVEGDLDPLARELAAELDAERLDHPRFLTATLGLADGSRLDLARARREIYPEPAALPVVEPADLESDLGRRDFSLNALAVLLAPAVERGRLIDLHGGREDLAAGRLRVLHPRSFLDDPTRILRGVRFEARFGFRFDAGTEQSARAAVASGAIERLSAARLGAGLAAALDDGERSAARLERLGDLGLLARLAPGLDAAAVRRSVEIMTDLESAALPAGLATRGWRRALLALASALDARGRAALAARLALPAAERELVLDGPGRVARASGELVTGAPAHTVVALLERLGDEELARLSRTGPAAERWVARFVSDLRDLRLRIRAADLIAAGASPGPELGQALRRTRDARVDGAIGPEQELDFALAAWREAGR